MAKKQTVTISVVVPSYNHENYVIQAIKSVLAQSLKGVDLIVIDDGSTDGSGGLIEEFLKKNGGFRFVRRGNRGLIHTLNEGVGMARGDLFCELASDDYLPPDSLEIRSRPFLNDSGLVAVYGDAISVLDERVTGQRLTDEKRKKVFYEPDPVPSLLRATQPIFATGLFRRDVFIKMGGFDERFRYYEDLDTPLRLYLEGKVVFIDRPVLYRREHAANVSGQRTPRLLERILCYDKFLEDPRLAPYRKIIRHRLMRTYLALARIIDKNKLCGGPERDVLQKGWQFAWMDPRLFYLLLRYGRRRQHEGG